MAGDRLEKLGKTAGVHRLALPLFGFWLGWQGGRRAMVRGKVENEIRSM
jgi:hypothetical protein